MQNHTTIMKQIDKTLGMAATINHLLAYEQEGSNHFSENIRTEEGQDSNIVVLQYTGNSINQVPIRTDHFALVLCLEGTATRTINQFRFKLSPGSVHLAHPQTLNAYHDASENLRLHMLFFRHEFLADNMISEAGIGDLLERKEGHVPHRQLNEQSFPLMQGLFQKLDDEVNTQKLFHGQMMKLIFIELMLEASRLCGHLAPLVQQTNRPKQLTSKFKKLVENNYLNLKTVQEYADLLFVTPKHLSEVIKQETGLTPLHAIHTRLFQEAKYLLCASELSIKEISDKLNFDIGSHFSRFIKQFTGYYPTQYRRIQCAI
jgi:AraC family transcriptional activator of pobA